MDYKKYLLGVLVVVLASNCLDRIALGIVMQDIKTDLALSDTQLGVLTGIAFALFYAVMGIPIARWADRGNRKTIIGVATTLWSAATALCGLAGSFVQLLILRIAAAVGEAGCNPPAHSLIADYFSRSERPKAVAIFMLGAPIATVLGYFGGGWLAELYGWRTTFVVIGVPGLLIALVVFLTVKEPRTAPMTAVDAPDMTLRHAVALLWASRTFRHLLLFYALSSFFTTGVGQWKPSFFIRSHGLQTGELGTWFALIYGVSGLLGTYIGGLAATRFAARDEALQLKGIGLLYAFLGLTSPAIYLASNLYVAFAVLALTMLATGMVVGPMFATVHALVPQHMRAVSIAVFFLFSNLIGLGLGPLAVGMLSDALGSWAGADSLRYAILVFCPGYFWCALHLNAARKTVAAEVSAS